MEFSERFIKILEAEFPHVYEWQDEAGAVYEPHTHEGKVSLYITDGSITFSLPEGERQVNAGERLDIPAKTEHSAVVGSEGVIYIVGEEIEGDS